MWLINTFEFAFDSLVGPQVESEVTHSQHSITKEKISRIYGQTDAAFSFDDEKEARIRSCLSSVSLGRNPHSQDQTQGLPESLARKGQKESSGQTLPSTEGLQKDPPSMVSRVGLQQKGSSNLPTSLRGHSYRCLEDRLGGHSERAEVQGTWSPLFRTFHINVLELMVVLLSLRRLRLP